MKNTTTQNRTLDSLTLDEIAQLDFMLAKMQNQIANGRLQALSFMAECMYHVVYPRTKAEKRHFTGRQRRVLQSIKLG